MSKSYSNLLDLSGNDDPMFTKPMAKNFTHNHDGLSKDSDQKTDDDSDESSSVSQERLILVTNTLPLHAEKKPDGTGWDFHWDEEALFLQLKDGIPEDMETIFVGSLKVDILDQNEQEEVSSSLFEKFKCMPVFIEPDLKARFYHGFCKQQIWPLFHYMLPLSSDHGGIFDRNLWQAYVSVNKIFAYKVMEVLSPEDDFVWIHDYHLMVLPTFLRKRYNKVNLGFFLHSPFPSSEIYRTLPVREELLRALLNADLIGFHTFDYARHFLSCCSRMLGLEFQSKRGHICLEYYGRTVGIKIMPVGVHVGRLIKTLHLDDTIWRIGELKAMFEGKTVLLGVDDMDVFKGIGLKLLAMEQLLRNRPELVGKVVLAQLTSPARGKGKEIVEVETEVFTIARRINQEFGNENYEPVVLIVRHVPLYERIAFYTVADVCVVTAVRDGMNLIPYEYVICREGTNTNQSQPPETVNGQNVDLTLTDSSHPKPKKRSMLIVSEFIGCSPSLSGAIRVNPWNTESVADALNSAITMSESEQHVRHEKHYQFVSNHSVGYWAQSFIGDLERTCRDHKHLRCYGMGFGLKFRAIALDPNFRKLHPELISRTYRSSVNRVILLDYDGTMINQNSIIKTPSASTVAMINNLCNDSRNVVFIVSGRGRGNLSEWFRDCDKLGIAAEHGYYIRRGNVSEWQEISKAPDFTWKEIALPVMKLYTESTDGSFIEVKESALVWHHRNADPDFGSWQAKELLDHLESVLVNEPVLVTSGNHIVEVKPQRVNKGMVVEYLVNNMKESSKGLPDFVLCIGDDRSDEDMFEKLEELSKHEGKNIQVFACTVGQKPSKARYYLDDTSDVMKLLQGFESSDAFPNSANLVAMDHEEPEVLIG